MYLSRVEMTGFKSFADKTVIEFDQGLTAVVGPNGSGKSNLSEAIRWVLGEQSAKSLRGSKMEDVIFNGTSHRKPVNLAKVTIVLNNEDRYLDLDFSEIAISRSYHRNGESNYTINNEPCRLKDIVDLLLDSGLGKNSFSIISQGQVEQIFLNKPEERRTIFEEAAGVQKYQYRKNEAQRKLFRSQDHLSRVRDIIHELKLQHAPLKKQREAALTYQNLKEQLKRYEVALYAYQIEQSKHAWDKAQAEFESLQANIQDNQTTQASLQQTLITHKQTYESLIETLDQENSQLQSILQTIEGHKRQLGILEQQLSFQETSSQEKEALFQTQSQELVTFTQELEHLQSEIATQESDNVALQSHLRDLQSRRQELGQLSDAKLESIRAELIEYYQAHASAKNQLQHHHTQAQRLAERIAKTRTQLTEIDQAEAEKKQRFMAVKDHFEVIKASLRDGQKKLQESHENFVQLQSNEQGFKQKLFDMERDVNRLHNQIEGLKQHQEEYVGYYPGVRYLMKHAHQVKGVHQPLAELIFVKPPYETAIEIALGASSQHIVVEHDQAAKEAIQLLKQAKAGRATFLPLTNIQGRSLQGPLLHQAQNAPGFLGMAIDLVSYDTTYQQVVANALGTTVVVDRLENAQTLAKQSKFKLKIVTLDGDILMPGGSITGGRQKQASSMLRRQSEREQLQETYDHKRDNLQALEASYQRLQEQLKISQSDIQDQRQDIRQKEQAYQEAQSQLALAQQHYTQEQQQIKLLSTDLDQLQAEMEHHESQEVTLKQSLADYDQHIQDLQTTLNQANVSQEDRQHQLEQIDQDIQSRKTHAAVLKVTLDQNLQKQTQLQEVIAKHQAWIEDYHQQVANATLTMDDIQAGLSDHQSALSQEEAQLHELHERIEMQRQERSNLQKEIGQLEQELQSLQGSLQGYMQAAAKSEAQIEKHQSMIDTHLAYLSEEYQLSYEAAAKQGQVIDSLKEAKQVVSTLKRQIDQLGPINLQAIEDFEELDERYQTLVEQEADLLGAMDQLQTTMDEMDQEVQQRFGVTFQQINLQFQTSFKKLFGGGQASLELTEPDDLLTTGIDIIAQPPGKRKQNLALLSGGERALTAIALLFAILETKPVPFVVLDEVEAALDDANVYRYGEYIQTFTQQTQFIVITHRKGTMEHADVLYGVTMQQAGISKLASVRLTEALQVDEASELKDEEGSQS